MPADPTAPAGTSTHGIDAAKALLARGHEARAADLAQAMREANHPEAWGNTPQLVPFGHFAQVALTWMDSDMAIVLDEVKRFHGGLAADGFVAVVRDEWLKTLAELDRYRDAPAATPDYAYQRAARAYLLGINLVATDPLLRELAGDAGFRAAVDAGREDLTRRIAELEEAVRQMTFERDLACDVADQARAERDVQRARADGLAQQVADLQGQLAITKGSNT